jgi:hypothetical protein
MGGGGGGPPGPDLARSSTRQVGNHALARRNTRVAQRGRGVRPLLHSYMLCIIVQNRARTGSPPGFETFW